MPQVKFVPVFAVLLGHVKLGVFKLVRWRFDLYVSAGAKVHVFAGRQLEYQLFNKGGDVVVGAHFACPLLNAEYFLGHLNFHVLLNRHLAGQAVTHGGFALADVALLGGQN